jgi:hypothetical protein
MKKGENTMQPKMVFQNERGFVTDFGREQELRGEGDAKILLPRYGVWTKSSRGRHEVSLTTNDLAEAKQSLEGK